MSECIEWTKSRTKRGYGRVGRRRNGKFRVFGAHRMAWAEANGVDIWSMPRTQVIRHTCDNPPCINPEHLLDGTQKNNVQDAVDRGLLFNLTKTHCPAGHEYAGDNLIIEGSRRICRTCRNEGKRRRRRAHA